MNLSWPFLSLVGRFFLAPDCSLLSVTHSISVLQEAGDDGIATDQMIYTVPEIERIVRLAATLARGRTKVVTRYVHACI